MIDWEKTYDLMKIIAAGSLIVLFAFFATLFFIPDNDTSYLTCDEITENQTAAYDRYQEETQPIYEYSELEGLRPEIRDAFEGERIRVDETFDPPHDKFYVDHGSETYVCVIPDPGHFN